eukprot:TRINITY_DN278_c0_g1_i1.p1 TRINITY_DN278_c0_g1~~TRINITY_DN278_c0_g1_i1.p1  ORF type:complete len:138 (-),score=15.66 TRINITY_DN278_c0_g1_i1:361-774(-)
MTAAQLTKFVIAKDVVDADYLKLGKGHADAKLLSIRFKDILDTFMNANPTWTLLYRSSRDGATAKNFHEGCDGKSPTITLIKVKGKPHIFGGYSPKPWRSIQSSSQNVYQQSDTAFIFLPCEHQKEHRTDEIQDKTR